MSHLLKHKYAQYLARTLISKEDWDELRPKRDKASMARKWAIVLAMIDKGVSQRRIAVALDMNVKMVHAWLRNDRLYARQIRRKQRGLSRKGLAEFQLWAESQSNHTVPIESEIP